MKRLAAVLLLAASALAGPAKAQAPTLSVGGETYVRAFEDTNWPDHFMEFTRPGETVETWTRLVTLHYFADFSRTPQQMAGQLARAARMNYPNADPRISENVDSGDAMVTFVATAPGSGTDEIDAFRYGRGGAGKGIIAAQYAVRIRHGALTAARQTELRGLLLDALRGIDLAQARALFQD